MRCVTRPIDPVQRTRNLAQARAVRVLCSDRYAIGMITWPENELVIVLIGAVPNAERSFLDSYFVSNVSFLRAASYVTTTIVEALRLGRERWLPPQLPSRIYRTCENHSADGR